MIDLNTIHNDDSIVITEWKVWHFRSFSLYLLNEFFFVSLETLNHVSYIVRTHTYALMLEIQARANKINRYNLPGKMVMDEL